MIFFADENIAPRLAALLETFDPEQEIRPLLNYFERGTPDVQWITKVAAWPEKPVRLSGDARILSRKEERAALLESKLTFVFFAKGWMHVPWHEQAWKMIKVWPDIVRNVSKVRLPALFEVKLGTLKVELLSPVR